jgi:hypothetical protein
MTRTSVWRASLIGVVMALAFMAAPALASADGPTAIGQDANGVSYVGFGDSGVIERFDANGNPLSSFNTSQLETSAITVDPSGNVWAMDGSNVYEYTQSGSLIESFNVTHCAGDSQPGNPAEYGGLAVTSNAVYVASPCFAFLARYSLTGTLEQQVNLPGQPRGITVGPAGSKTNQVFVAIPGLGEVLSYDGNTFATSSSEPPLTVDGFGSTSWEPCGVADKNDSGGDELIVSDCENNYLYVYDPGHLYGPGGTYSEYRTLGHGTGSSAGSVNDPTAIALHANDGSALDTNIFIADYNNNRIQRWNDSGYTYWTAQANSPGNSGGGSAPTNSTPPSIGGNPVQGSSVTCSTGTWNGSPTSYTYAWLDNGSPISGATNSSYTIQASDVGQSLTCSVTASNGSGTSAAATSAAVVPSSNATAPANTAAPSITGQAVQGGTLTCNNGTWTGTAPSTYTYAWSRNGSQIATGSTYVVTAADVGQAITCTVTASNSAGTISATSTAVTPTASSGTGTVGVTIDNGAVYTDTPAVTVTAVAPSGTTAVIISDDGSFAEAQTFPVAGNSEYSWTLQTSGNERLPKTVYVRFVLAGSTPYLTLSDDIILDQTAPTVQSATLTPGSASASADVARVARSAAGRFVLRVKAKDNISGVAKLQYASSKHARKVTTVRYSRSLRIVRASAAKWARVIDGAGNYGRWRKVVRVK